MTNKKYDFVEYPLSPVDVETIHRVLGVNVLNNFSVDTENTGGGNVADVYRLLDGSVLAVSSEFISHYPSYKAWTDCDSEPNYFGVEDLFVSECSELHQLETIWRDNTAFLAACHGKPDMADMDAGDLVHFYGDKLAINERHWVELFIQRWEEVQENG